MRSPTVYDADSVAALIVTRDARYLMQRRDDLAGIDFPGMWGLFGGAPESGEEAESAMRRELFEELAFSPKSLSEVATMVFDERAAGGWYCRRRFYEVVIDGEDVPGFILGEGVEMALFTASQVARLEDRAIPYDVCAIAMHARIETSRASLRSRKPEASA